MIEGGAVGNKKKSPKVFISYAHGSENHNKWVENLAKELRIYNIDSKIDIWDLKPGQDIGSFIEKMIDEADFVINVCTPEYAKKSNELDAGVGYEKGVLSAEMLRKSNVKRKCIPIIRQGTSGKSLPRYLAGKFALDFKSTKKFNASLDKLQRSIRGISPKGKPPLGGAPDLNQKDIVDYIAKSTGIPIKEVRPVLKAALDTVAAELKKVENKKVELSDLGTFKKSKSKIKFIPGKLLEDDED